MKTQFNSFLQIIGLALALSVFAAVPLVGDRSALAADQTVTITDTVAAALSYNPRLKVLQDNQVAVTHEVDQAKGGYYPRLDMSLGYGAESHNDEYTRSDDRRNNFYSRTDANLQLSQLLYDGQETASQVGIEESKLDSAKLRVLDNAESITLDAIIAHMEVYRQRALYSLAGQNVRDHEEILGMLNERQKAGAGSIADVTQTEGRLSRAKATEAETLALVKRAEANYQRVVGKLAGDVEFFTPPANLVPKSREEAILAVEASNPKVRALEFNVAEAQSRVELSDSSFLPKINAVLSTTYSDWPDSVETYEFNNKAMVRLNWNLINGGSDVAARKAAIARKLQAVNTKDDQLVQVVEEADATWAELQAAKQRVVAFGDATNFNRKTLDSYMKQFTVGQRSLLDVLDARNELFQSSGLLVTAKVNEVIASERLLALAGRLNDSLQMDKALYLVSSPPR